MQTLLRCAWGGLVSSLLCCTSCLPEIAEEVIILVLSEKQTETLAKMTVREGPTPTVANPQTPNEGSGTVLALRPAGSPGNSGPGVSVYRTQRAFGLDSGCAEWGCPPWAQSPGLMRSPVGMLLFLRCKLHIS